MRNLKEMKIGEGGKIQGNRDSQSYAKTDIIFFHKGDIGKVRVGRKIGLREHLHMTSDVLGVFLTYLTTYPNQILYCISLFSKIR